MKKTNRTNKKLVVIFIILTVAVLTAFVIIGINLMKKSGDLIDQAIRISERVSGSVAIARSTEQAINIDELRTTLDAEKIAYLVKTENGIEIESISSGPVMNESIMSYTDIIEAAFAGERGCNYDDISRLKWDGLVYSFSPVYAKDGKVESVACAVLMSGAIKQNINDIKILALVGVIVFALFIVLGLSVILVYKTKVEQTVGANNTKYYFLAQMSHQMRSPMNAVIGLTRMALESDDIATVKEHLRKISASSDHLIDLINDFHDMSEIESGRLTIEKQVVNTGKEIEEIKQTIAPLAEKKNQNLRFNVDPNLPELLCTDYIHVRQVLVHLLSNAIRYTGNDGKIECTIKVAEQVKDNYRISFSVKDNGIGIDPEAISTIFTPFESGNAKASRKYGGTGLGLAIASQLTEMMGGTLEVESEKGSGSEFMFDIWMEHSEGSYITGTTKTADFSLAGKKILVVEDSEINLLVAVDMFEGCGAEVTTATNGFEGYKKFIADSRKYDYIFMDIQMPVMDGYEATKKIRNSGMLGAAQIPIIAMTANVFKEDIELSLLSGMNAHVGKPFDLEQIKNAIAEVDGTAAPL